LDENGYVDYVAAINEAASKGVTPENNFVVALWQIFGPVEVSDTDRERYFRLLGVAVPVESGEYYRPPSDRLRKQLQKAFGQPWSDSDFPEPADWLAANDKFIQRLVDCSNRSRYFSPAVPPKNRPKVMLVLSPATLAASHVADALGARAMSSVRKGKLDEAFRDSLACHRLGRLVGQGPACVDVLTCIRLDWIAARVDLAIVASGHLSAEQARKFDAEIKQLSPLPSISEKLRWSQRFEFLDAAATLEKDLVDPNAALRLGNKWFDRMAEDAHSPRS